MSQRKPAAKESARTTASTPSSAAKSKPPTTKPTTKTGPNKPATGAASKTPTPTTKTTKSPANSVPKSKPVAKTPTPSNRAATKTPTANVGKTAKAKSATSKRGSSANATKTVAKGIAFEIGIVNDEGMDRPQSAVPTGLHRRRKSEPPKPITRNDISKNLQKAEERKKAYGDAKMKRIHDLDADSKKFTDKLSPYIERELTSTSLGGDKIPK